MKNSLFYLCLFLGVTLNAIEPPVAFKGRFHPLDAYEKIVQQSAQIHVRPSTVDPKSSLYEQLKNLNDELLMLPGRYHEGEWFALNALALNVEGKPIGNFTLYPDALFYKLQTLYRENKPTLLFQTLAEAYRPLAGSSYLGSLHYPTEGQLKAESLYYRLPLIPLALALYGLATFALALSWTRLGFVFFLSGFIIHTATLALRCYILGRPPVSNMFETVLYVPWIAVLLSLVFGWIFRSRLALLGGCITTLILLSLLQITGLNNSLDNVQAVLNSQYWLLVHVLLVVGSYGVFLLGGILAHFYLIKSQESDTLAKLIAQSIYLGLALLIPGTLLGGVWAAQSWGRFWDWDPKEAWAFISICIYLILVHAYTFKHIGARGLAIGAVLGIQAIVFTWYGVNYILGTGLHSYGFGEGGERYYLAFLAAELLFLGWATQRKSLSTQE